MQVKTLKFLSHRYVHIPGRPWVCVFVSSLPCVSWVFEMYPYTSLHGLNKPHGNCAIFFVPWWNLWIVWMFGVVPGPRFRVLRSANFLVFCGRGNTKSLGNQSNYYYRHLFGFCFFGLLVGFCFFLCLVCTFVDGKIVHAAWHTQPPTFLRCGMDPPFSGITWWNPPQSLLGRVLWSLVVLLMAEIRRSPVEVGCLFHCFFEVLAPSQVVVWDFSHQQYLMLKQTTCRPLYPKTLVLSYQKS